MARSWPISEDGRLYAVVFERNPQTLLRTYVNEFSNVKQRSESAVTGSFFQGTMRTEKLLVSLQFPAHNVPVL